MTEEIKQGSEIIAKFMDLEKTSYLWDIPSQMEYHRSWEWIMDVVKKIDELYSEAFIHNYEAFPSKEEFISRILSTVSSVEPYTDVLALPISTPIEEVFAEVVKFINPRAFLTPTTPHYYERHVERFYDCS